MGIRKRNVFREVMESKSFTKAAAAALLSELMVSEHIRNLEEKQGEPRQWALPFSNTCGL